MNFLKVCCCYYIPQLLCPQQSQKDLSKNSIHVEIITAMPPTPLCTLTIDQFETGVVERIDRSANNFRGGWNQVWEHVLEVAE